jgi:segregation and condensation protein B
LDNLDNVLEAILFLAGDAVEVKEMAEKLGVSKEEILKAVEKLLQKYGGGSGIQILSFNGKLQFSSNAAYAPQIEVVLNPIKERELSRAMLEVAAIIAYKQPITRLEIEEIRGVNSEYVIMMLLRHNLIQVVGRKNTVGKPLLYATTDKFLKRFQLSSLEDLPDFDEVMERIKVLAPKEPPRDLFAREEQISEKEEIPDFLKGEENIEMIN